MTDIKFRYLESSSYQIGQAMTVLIREDRDAFVVISGIGEIRLTRDLYDVAPIKASPIRELGNIAMYFCRLPYIDFSSDCEIDSYTGPTEDYYTACNKPNHDPYSVGAS